MVPAPRTSRHRRLATVVFAITAAGISLLALSLQVCCAILTCPLLLSRGGRLRFTALQNRLLIVMYRAIITLNPLWRCEVRLHGEAPGPPGGKLGSILFCNHRSNADPLFLTALSRKGIRGYFVYKSSLGKVPVFGWSLRLCGGHLPVKAGDKEQVLAALDQSKKLVEAGCNLVVFPEGTRSPSGVLQDFKPSYFRICDELGCPAVPVCITGTERALPVDQKTVDRANVTIQVGSPIWPAAGGEKALTASVATAIQDMGRQLMGGSGSSSSGVGEGCADPEDPFVTGLPYPWWEPPAALRDIPLEEQVALLRSKKAHKAGSSLF